MSRKVRDYRGLADVAQAAAERAAAYIRSAQRPPAGAAWSRKGVLDYVTEVDRGAERLIAQALREAVPQSAILGEELTPGGAGEAAGAAGAAEAALDAAAAAASPSSPALLWIVDPLDGTTNYLHGYPQYGVSIAALVDGQLAAGVVLDVARGLTYRAAAGEGARCGTERLAVSHVTETKHALIGTGFPFREPHLLPRYLRHFTAISRCTSGIRRAGSASLDLVDVARGRFEGFWELDLAPWDVAAGTLLVREAGGLVTDLEGSQDVLRKGPIVAGNPSIHAWLLEVLSTC